jgi:hypothetical protein
MKRIKTYLQARGSVDDVPAPIKQTRQARKGFWRTVDANDYERLYMQAVGTSSAPPGTITKLERTSIDEAARWCAAQIVAP